MKALKWIDLNPIWLVSMWEEEIRTCTVLEEDHMEIQGQDGHWHTKKGASDLDTDLVSSEMIELDCLSPLDRGTVLQHPSKPVQWPIIT